MPQEDPILKALDELIATYQKNGALTLDELTTLKTRVAAYQSKRVGKICHRSMSGSFPRTCMGPQCDRYKNCRVAWKRAEIDMKTYSLEEESL